VFQDTSKAINTDTLFLIGGKKKKEEQSRMQQPRHSSNVAHLQLAIAVILLILTVLACAWDYDVNEALNVKYDLQLEAIKHRHKPPKTVSRRILSWRGMHWCKLYRCGFRVEANFMLATLQVVGDSLVVSFWSLAKRPKNSLLKFTSHHHPHLVV
jgi:hypothetical protein